MSAPQVHVCVAADRGAPQQPAVPDGGDGGPAAGPDAAEQLHSAQAAAATHRVHRGEAAHQLDVHLPLRLPAGQLLSPAIGVMCVLFRPSRSC